MREKWAILSAALAAVLRTGMPIGVVYVIWSTAGVAATAVLGAVLFDEPLTSVIALGIAIGGVVLVETGSHDAGTKTEVTPCARCCRPAPSSPR